MNQRLPLYNQNADFMARRRYGPGYELDGYNNTFKGNAQYLAQNNRAPMIPGVDDRMGEFEIAHGYELDTENRKYIESLKDQLKVPSRDTREHLHDVSRFMVKAARMGANRGVPKNSLTTAQLDGYNPQNPLLFGMQQQMPVPYNKYMQEQSKFQGVLNGFDTGGRPGEQSMAGIASRLRAHQDIMQQVMNKPERSSITAGVPRDAAVNLYEIKQRALRVNSMYGLQ